MFVGDWERGGSINPLLERESGREGLDVTGGEDSTLAKGRESGQGQAGTHQESVRSF